MSGAEKSGVAGMESDGELVRLNVGGSLYTTFRQTLLREENTFFTELLSDAKEDGGSGDGSGTGADTGNGTDTATGIEPEHDTPQVAVRLPDGSYFIDRDGQLFAYILDYLRSGKLLLTDGFQQAAMLREEAIFYQLGELQQLLTDYLARRFRPLRSHTTTGTSTSISVPSGGGAGGALLSNGEQMVMMSAPEATGGYITLGYRGTFAFGRDGQADVKFRKLHRILVCGKVSLCREVFGDTLNESRDPDREGHERYTSRLYLKHQCLEKACDQMAEKGFKLIATCCSGANGLTTATHPLLAAQSGSATQQVGTKELMNQRNSGDFEEQRWAHYTEYIFYREPALAPLFTLAAASSPRNSLIGLT